MENKSQATSETSPYRYERKFVTGALDREQVEALIELHPAMFSEIFHARFVNNMYFDSLSMDNLRANLAGVRNRVKHRIRWYGDLLGEVENPKLEIKIKDGLMGRKITVPLPPFRLDEAFSLNGLIRSLREADVADLHRLRLTDLEPVLLNRYRRRYFQSIDGAYRITVDSELGYYGIARQGNRFLEKTIEDPAIVVELKYDHDRDRGADWIANHFPFRLSRNSKYVQGVEQVNR
jgi:SPX domain protein involved in polyphosphate accumulation